MNKPTNSQFSMPPNCCSFDVGCVLATRKVPIPGDAFREELSATMARAGAELMLEVLRDLDGFQERKRPQGEEGVTYGELICTQFHSVYVVCTSYVEFVWLRTCGLVSSLLETLRELLFVIPELPNPLPDPPLLLPLHRQPLLPPRRP